MSLDAKYQFALNGYEFPDYPDHKAILLDNTKMKTVGNYNRCIRAGTAMECLPNNFVVLFSTLKITDCKLPGAPSKYQVELKRNKKYLHPHRNPVTDYGMAQFINCCLPQKSTVTHLDGQDMRVKQCKLITTLHKGLSPFHKVISPAYIRTTADIKIDEELLMPSGYGGSHKI